LIKDQLNASTDTFMQYLFQIWPEMKIVAGEEMPNSASWNILNSPPVYWVAVSFTVESVYSSRAE